MCTVFYVLQTAKIIIILFLCPKSHLPFQNSVVEAYLPILNSYGLVVLKQNGYDRHMDRYTSDPIGLSFSPLRCGTLMKGCRWELGWQHPLTTRVVSQHCCECTLHLLIRFVQILFRLNIAIFIFRRVDDSHKNLVVEPTRT